MSENNDKLTATATATYAKQHEVSDTARAFVDMVLSDTPTQAFSQQATTPQATVPVPSFSSTIAVVPELKDVTDKRHGRLETISRVSSVLGRTGTG